MAKTTYYYQKIVDRIEPKARVLDLGCGDGTLLDMLIAQKHIHGYGIEIDFENILACIKRGINVFQGNIDEGLREYSDKSYDYVIISRTLQEIHKPLFVLNEILRVGQKGIITFPNFAHWKIRAQLITGKAPHTSLLHHEWFDTPNIRVVTIQDFRELCASQGIEILEEIMMDPIPLFPESVMRKFSNLLSEKGMFIIRKNKFLG